MLKILNKKSAFACLVLFGTAIFFCFLGSHAGASADAVDVQMVVTTYRDGKVYQTTTSSQRLRVSDNSIAGGAPPANQPAAAGDIVISQIYSNGGNPGSTYQNNYLELYNRTDNAIAIDGWRIYFASAAGPFDQAISFVSSQGIPIGGHKYLLIRLGPESANGAPVPADLAGPTSAPSPPPGFPPFPIPNLSPSGKVFLTMPDVNAFGACPLPNPQIVDLVGYGATASCFEGSGPTGTTSNSTAALRKAAGCTDTDNNAADFDVGAPAPRNSGSPQNFCGPPPAVIQFSQATYNVTEHSGSIAVLVTRTVNTTGSSTVEYITSDSSGANNCNVLSGRASARCDYILSVGTLKFAPGETGKLIDIPLIDDAYAEGTENFSVILGGPTGGTLGSPAVTNVVIADNDSSNGSANPIDQTAFFVRQHYVDFLGREPDNDGITYWSGDVDNCTPKPECTEIKRINVSASFFLSIEFQESGYLAYRAYKTAYGDLSGQAVVQNVPTTIQVPIIRLHEFLSDAHTIGEGVVVGSSNWAQQLENNKVAYFASFVVRPRFLGSYPLTMTAAEFVDKLNTRAGNVLTTSERDTLVNELQLGQKTRAEVFRAIAENDTLKRNESNRAFVLMQYFGYLRRNPNDPQDSDYSGYKFWLDKLNEHNGNFIAAQMVKAFLDSIEYRQRFGP